MQTTTSTAQPDGRAATFQPNNGLENDSGTILVVEAYAVLWVILFAFIWRTWRSQRTIDQRVDDLSAEVAKARRAKAEG
jgi:hypothetical protein